MFIVKASTGERVEIDIDLVEGRDYKNLTATKYFFKWKYESAYEVYKLRIKGQEDILGVVSMEKVVHEERIEIRLLATSRENMGKEKIYDGIAGNLIAYACRLALKEFGAGTAVTLFPKTELIPHYVNCYGMIPAGRHLMLLGDNLFEILKKYDHD